MRTAAAGIDIDGALARWFKRVGGGTLALVRPDRQVFGVYKGTAPKALRRAVEVLAAGLGG